MRHTLKTFTLAAVLATLSWVSTSQAAFYGFPRALLSHLDRVSFDTPSLSPMAFTRFCMQYPTDCGVPRISYGYRRAVLRKGDVALTEALWVELVTVNRDVNRAIVPQRNLKGLFGEEWIVSPKAGDCNDYAVTKRHELLARGWPMRSLLLTEVVTGWGEHHLVLVVRTAGGDLVLDNLNANVRPVSKTRYQWVRAQSPGNPKFWSVVSVPTGMRMATLSR